MDASWRRLVGASAARLLASLVVLAAVSPHPAPAGSDRPPLARLLADAGIAGPTKPFGALSFLMPDLAGGTVDLDGLRGRVVLLGAR